MKDLLKVVRRSLNIVSHSLLSGTGSLDTVNNSPTIVKAPLNNASHSLNGDSGLLKVVNCSLPSGTDFRNPVSFTLNEGIAIVKGENDLPIVEKPSRKIRYSDMGSASVEPIATGYNRYKLSGQGRTLPEQGFKNGLPISEIYNIV